MLINVIAKQFKYYADCSVILSPCGLRSIMRVAQYIRRYGNYRGGHPVPRAKSY